MQSLRGLVARDPVVVARKHSPAMQQLPEELLQNEHRDRVVCDFLTSTVNLPFCEPFILFEHNVETQIWRRYGEGDEDALRRWYGGTSDVRQIVSIRSSRSAYVASVGRTAPGRKLLPPREVLTNRRCLLSVYFIEHAIPRGKCISTWSGVIRA